MTEVGSDSSIETPGPTMTELRAAGVGTHIDRLRAALDATLGGTRRGRLALRLTHWYARRMQ